VPPIAGAPSPPVTPRAAFGLRSTVRLKARGRTIAVGRVTPARAGRVRIKLKPTKAAAAIKGRRIVARLELTQGKRRVTKPIVLTTPAR